MSSINSIKINFTKTVSTGFGFAVFAMLITPSMYQNIDQYYFTGMMYSDIYPLETDQQDVDTHITTLIAY